MKFKVGLKKQEIEKIKVAPINDILLQSQVEDGLVPMSPPRFIFSWILKYKDGTVIKSEWTPVLQPSITNTVESKSGIEEITILGKNISHGYEIEMAKINYKLVRGFGYIAEQHASREGVTFIIGMWIELTENRIVKIFQNGNVKEFLK